MSRRQSLSGSKTESIKCLTFVLYLSVILQKTCRKRSQWICSTQYLMWIIDIHPSKGSVTAAAAAVVVQIGLLSTDGDLIPCIVRSFPRGVRFWFYITCLDPCIKISITYRLLMDFDLLICVPINTVNPASAAAAIATVQISLSKAIQRRFDFISCRKWFGWSRD